MRILQFKFRVYAKPSSIVLVLFLCSVLYIGAAYRVFSGTVSDESVFERVLFSHSANLIYLAVFALYYKRLNVAMFSRFYFFSLLFLLAGIAGQMLGFDIFAISYYPAEKTLFGLDYYVESITGLPRYASWVFDPNWVPLLTFPYIAYMYAVREKHRQLKTLILVPLLIVPLSRTFFVAMAIVLLIWLFVKLRRAYPVWKVACIELFISAVGCIFMFNISIVGSMTSLKTMALRLIMWKGLFSKLTGSGLLFGYGVEGSRSITVGLRGLDQYGTLHNTFLAILGDHGLIGFIPFLILLVLPLIKIRSFPYRLLWVYMVIYGMTLEFGFHSIIVLAFCVIPLAIKQHLIVEKHAPVALANRERLQCPEGFLAGFAT